LPRLGAHFVVLCLLDSEQSSSNEPTQLPPNLTFFLFLFLFSISSQKQPNLGQLRRHPDNPCKPSEDNTRRRSKDAHDAPRRHEGIRLGVSDSELVETMAAEFDRRRPGAFEEHLCFEGLGKV
jgi:hypothetical protein